MHKINMIPISQKVKLNPGSNSSLQVSNRTLHFQPISQTIAPSIIPISTNGTANPAAGPKPWNHSGLPSLIHPTTKHQQVLSALLSQYIQSLTASLPWWGAGVTIITTWTTASIFSPLYLLPLLFTIVCILHPQPE